MNGESNARHPPSIASRPGDALMIAVEGTVNPHVPGRVGGGALIFTGSLYLLPTCLNPAGPVQNSGQILCDMRQTLAGSVQTRETETDRVLLIKV